MATFKIVVQKQRNDGFYAVYIRVTHNRGVKYLRTDKIVDAKGINKKNKEVKDPFVLQSCSNKIARFAEMLNKVEIRRWDIHEVIAYLEKGTDDVCFSDYARKYHDDMYNDGHERNARNYELAYQHLERYTGTNKLMFSQLTSHLINGWIKSLEKTSRAKEMYPVCVRQIFKQALLDFNDYDSGIIRIATNPWMKIKIPRADTPLKKAISLDEVRAFFTAPLPESDRKVPLSELGRDVAMMVICLAGMNTVDIYNLKKENYINGIIGYERAKTRRARKDNAYIEMRVPNILLPIFEKYKDDTNSPYLFNFHRKMSTSDSFCANINVGIRQICEKSLGLPHDKTYCVYTFRHTWATVAQNDCGASLPEIGFAMNHSDKFKVTRTYVKVDFLPAWELNEKVINKIFFTTDKSAGQREKEKDPNQFTRFSYKQLIKGTLYFRGRILAQIENVGYNNVNEVIEELMSKIPETIPSKTLVQIRIENKDKNETQDYTREVK